MTPSKKITRANAMDLLRRFAREYRKKLGKAPAEIIIVGGGSIMLNYKFRDATQDFDVICQTSSGIKDVISRFADENDLPRDWMNTDCMKTASYSVALREVSCHYCWLNNQTMEIRTVSGVYLIAMKMAAHRDYRNDISDAIGIMFEEAERGNPVTYEAVQAAYIKLYHKSPDSRTQEQFRRICGLSISDLKNLYDSQRDAESHVADRLITYIENGNTITTKNVKDVAARIREKMIQKQ